MLEDAGCSNDDMRLARLLLSRTTVVVRVNNETPTAFISTKCAFQGDSLSGCFFTLSLAGSLYQLRAMYNPRPVIPVSDCGLPLEWEYADDVDFIDENIDKLRNMLPVCTDVLKQWDLSVNESKTEFVHLFLASQGEVDSGGALVQPSTTTNPGGPVKVLDRSFAHRLTSSTGSSWLILPFGHTARSGLRNPKFL